MAVDEQKRPRECECGDYETDHEGDSGYCHFNVKPKDQPLRTTHGMQNCLRFRPTGVHHHTRCERHELLSDSQVAEIKARAEEPTLPTALSLVEGILSDIQRMCIEADPALTGGELSYPTLAWAEAFNEQIAHARADVPALVASHCELAADRDELVRRLASLEAAMRNALLRRCCTGSPSSSTTGPAVITLTDGAGHYATHSADCSAVAALAPAAPLASAGGATREDA